MPDLCMIGGGASAMAAAVAAADTNPGLSIGILEKKEVLGKKLAATGNGRCNLSNVACPKVSDTLTFFSSIGLITRTDNDGRIYPYSQQAKDVVYSLQRQMKAQKIRVKTNCTVEKIMKNDKGFTVYCEGGKLRAKRVLLATGGKAGPQYGTSGDGYRMARSLGHRITRLAPVLTGLEVGNELEMLKGIRVRGTVSLWEDGKKIAQESGEIQFNENSVSGICVFNLSRFVRLRQGESFSGGMRRFRLKIDFLPDMEPEQVRGMLMQRCRILQLKTEELLMSLIPGPLALQIIKMSGLQRGTAAAKCSALELRRIAALLKAWELEIRGTKGWKSAQCTAGGVSLDDIDSETMESKLVPGLYFSGEIIDFDGPCGGFNLQNAWETGIRAGKAMARV